MRTRFPFHSNSVWPPLGLVAVFALAYLMLQGGVWIIEHASDSLRGQVASMPEILNIRAGILATAAAYYAVFRLWRFHPFCNIAYSTWLKSSPWTWRKALPLGPVHPVWQDAVVLAPLAALAYAQAHVDPTLPLISFALTYFILMTLLLTGTRTWLPCLLLGFLWPALILPVFKGWPIAGIFILICLVVWMGHRQSLRAFPWKRLLSENGEPVPADRPKSILELEIRVDPSTKALPARAPNLGWPFQVLSPKAGSTPIAPSTALAVGALFGWWTYCVVVRSEMPPSPDAVLAFALIGALFRVCVYCAPVRPSFNLWARIAAGRLVVPGFDQVLVTPLLAIGLAIGGGVLIRHAENWYPEVTAAVVATIWFVLLNGGPNMSRWLLTADHRYRMPSRNQANKQLLRPV